MVENVEIGEIGISGKGERAGQVEGLCLILGEHSETGDAEGLVRAILDDNRGHRPEVDKLRLQLTILERDALDHCIHRCEIILIG